MCVFLSCLTWTKHRRAAPYPLVVLGTSRRNISLTLYRTEIGLQPFMVAGMIREFPELLEVRPKRLKAVVKYLWKVRRRNRRRPDDRARRQILFFGVRCKEGQPDDERFG